jgi:hypothetical protein
MVRRRALKSFGYFSSVYPHCFPQPKEERTGIFRSFLFSLSFVFSFSAIGSGATPGGGGGGERGVGRICVSPFFVWDLFPELGP